MESLCRETRAFITLVASLGFFALPCSASAGDYMVRVLGDERAVRIGTRDSVTWGDAERLLFAAYDPRFKSAGPVDKGEKGEPVILPNLYEWDVRTDKLRVVYDLGDPSFCLSGDGYTSSKIWRNGKRFERAGFFGKEIERPFSPASYSEAYRDDVLCRPNPSIENRPAKRQGVTCPQS